MERGGTVGVHIVHIVHVVRTKLRHRSEGRSSAFVPDVEGNLSQDKRVVERQELSENHKYKRYEMSQRRAAGHTSKLKHVDILIQQN